MVVQHNMQAANANRMLGLTVNSQQKSTEKLSSGYRINRAADDAAGLAISEKMRSQIRGLDRASTNAQDGISVVQTAEGALNEVHSMLQRMNELATQAANDTNTGLDRKQIQLEVDQLTSEIDRVASTTQFNTMNLLDGSFTGKQLQVGSLSGQTIQLDIQSMDAKGLGLKGGVSETTKDTIAQHANIKSATPGITDATVADLKNIIGTAPTANTTYEYDATSKTWHVQNDPQGKDAGLTIDMSNFSVKDPSQKATITIDASSKDAKTVANLSKKGAALDPDKFTGTIDKDAADGTYTKTGTGWVNEKGETATVSADLQYDGAAVATGTTITISGHVDGTKGKTIADNKALDMSSNASAGKSMKQIQDAIDTVSTQRATLGAVQNRLEHTIANLDTTSENTQAAESRIRDTDMAKEMVTWSKNNILAQAGQSMLAQANQSNQGVLSLLQ